MDVIKRIEQLRNDRGWTKYRLAEEAMLTYSTLSAIYARSTPPKIEILEMLCDAFGVTLAQFFTEGEAAEPVSADEKQLLELYRAQSGTKKKSILNLLEKDI